MASAVGAVSQLIRQLEPARMVKPRRLVARVLSGALAGLVSTLLTAQTIESAPMLAYGLAALAGYRGLDWLREKSDSEGKEDKSGSR